MSFLAPQYLWGFLAIIPLVAAYLLKVKPRKQKTNAWFLWEKVFKEKNTSSLFSKMRNLLSLLLMLLALCLLVLGLSQPSFHQSDDRDLVIVIDRSASMQTRSEKSEGSETRMDVAKSKAHDLIRTLQTGQKASIAVIDQNLHFLTHLSSNTHRLHESVDKISASSLPLHKESVSALIKTTVTKDSTESESESGSKSSRIILITDGCGDFPDLVDEVKLDVLNIAPEARSDNLGIVAADIQQSPYNQSAQCMVKIVSSLEQETKAEIELFHPASGTVGKLTEVTVKPGMNKPFFFDVPNTESTTGEWLVKILREDQLPLDNSASLILRSLPSIPVSIPAENNYFYQRCVEAFSKSGGALQLVDLGASSSSKHITIVQGSLPDDAPKVGNFILFAPAGDSPLWSDIGEVQPVYLALSKNAQHPVIRHLDVNQLHFSSARQLTPPASAKIIVESDNGLPLIYQVTDQQRSVMVINTNPAASEFYLSPHFPVIVYDTATYLSGHSTELAAVYSTASQLKLNPEDIDSKITTPQDEVEYENALALHNVGVYHWSSKGTLKQASSATLSAVDSALLSKIETRHEMKLSTGYPLHFWCIVIAIILLVVESALYHRRLAD